MPHRILSRAATKHLIGSIGPVGRSRRRGAMKPDMRPADSSASLLVDLHRPPLATESVHPGSSPEVAGAAAGSAMGSGPTRSGRRRILLVARLPVLVKCGSWRRRRGGCRADPSACTRRGVVCVWPSSPSTTGLSDASTTGHSCQGRSSLQTIGAMVHIGKRQVCQATTSIWLMSRRQSLHIVVSTSLLRKAAARGCT